MIVQELKKIFETKRILMIIILSVLFYILFFQRNVGIPAYSSERVDLEVSLDLIEKYGNELDEIEYNELLNTFIGTEESDIDVWIKGNEDFRQYGIESYGSFLSIQDSLSDAAASSLTSQVSAMFTGEQQQAALDKIWKDVYMKTLSKSYDAEMRSNLQTAYYNDITKKYEKRIEERNQDEIYSLLPDSVMRKYLAILPDFAIFLFLSMILLVVPYSVKDTIAGIHILQYTAPKGHRFYWKKLESVFISSIILCVVETALFMLMLSKNDTFYFMNCFVSGFRNPFITFMKLTFGQYIIMSVVYTMVIGICLSLITYGLSSYAHNYISAIALQIPMIVFGIGISLALMSHFAEITQNITLLFMIPIICLLLAIIGNAIRFFLNKWCEQI